MNSSKSGPNLQQSPEFEKTHYPLIRCVLLFTTPIQCDNNHIKMMRTVMLSVWCLNHFCVTKHFKL